MDIKLNQPEQRLFRTVENIFMNSCITRESFVRVMLKLANKYEG